MPPGRDIRRASASAPGTCGELAQGMLDGVLCMVTCPVDMRSVATVELTPGEGRVIAPEDSPKALQAVKVALRYLDEPGLNARLWLNSRLPRGKGMASSTADVAAAIAATASATGRELSPAQIAGIALEVEPSDGVMFPDVIIFDHIRGSVARPLGHPPPMRVVVLDFGGVVDTLSHNNSDRGDALAGQSPKMADAVGLISRGIRFRDPALIGDGATISAVANQEISFNPHLDAVLGLYRQAGSVGVNVAHSGTVIGMLFPDECGLAERAAAMAQDRLPGLESVLQCRLEGGGVLRC